MRKHCPAKEGAKTSAKHHATDFYARPVVVLGSKRGPQFTVDESGDAGEETRRWTAAVLFTPPLAQGKATGPEIRRRLTNP